MQLPLSALQLAGYFHGGRAFAGPTTVQVDLTDACNQNCVVCWLHAPDLKDKNARRLERRASLPWELYLRLLDELKALGTEEIYFAGGGEPLAYSKPWQAMKAALHRGLTASLHTNFSLVDDDGVKRLIDLGVHYVTVSLWAGTREGYAATHPGTDPVTFDDVTRRLEALNAAKVDRPVTKLYHVLTGANAHEALAMLELAEQIGCDAVELAVADVVPGATDPHGLRPEQAATALDAVGPWLERAAWRRPRLLGADALVARLTALSQGVGSDTELVHTLPCLAGWTYARVMADGRVIPCLKAHRIPSGNLHERGFGEIWHGARQALFRSKARALRKDDPFFRQIGNDPEAACGCERGCDNLEGNRLAAGRLATLTRPERLGLKAAAHLPDAFAARFERGR